MKGSGDTPQVWQYARICAQRRLSARRATRAAARQAGGAATRTLPPLNQLIPHFRRPRTLPSSSDHPETRNQYRAQVIRRTPSELERSAAWIPLNIAKTPLVHFRALTARAQFGFKQTIPSTWLRAGKPALPRRMTPDVAHHIVRPKSRHEEIGQCRPIGQIEEPQN